MHFRELSTPALVVDLDVMERNLERMAAYCKSHRLGLRPHTKTHKTIEIAKMQMEMGALGLTVAKVGEAEVMRHVDAKQILVAHPIFGQEKLARLAEVAADVEVLIAVDDEATAHAISAAAVNAGCNFGILVEFDAGSRRCGVSAATCAELGERIAKLPGVRLRGLMTYFGSVWGSEEERKQEMERARAQVEQAVGSFGRAGLPLEIVSGGSTPAADYSHTIAGLTEIRPGTYVFNDMNTYYQGVCRLEDCAVRVVTTVVSTAVPGQAVVDAGSKTLSHDALGSGPKKGFGYIVERPEVPVVRLNEEHGYLDVSQSNGFKVGDVLTIIPNHVCTCVNMHDEIYLIRKEQVIGSWQVAARGKIR